MVKTTLEKGKGLILGKLWNIILIEGNLQIRIRIFLYSNKEELIEKDDCFSKANYSSRKNYSIESAILEKRIIFDNSLITLKLTVYNLTDLKSYYNRQLPNLGSIIKEFVGCNGEVMRLFMKIMPKFHYYVCTSYRVSAIFYGRERIELAGTG